MCENWGVHTKLRGDVSRKDLLAILRELPYQTWLSESVEDGAIDYPSAWVNVMLKKEWVKKCLTTEDKRRLEHALDRVAG